MRKNLFTELEDGLRDLKLHREGKIRLKTTHAGASEIRSIDKCDQCGSRPLEERIVEEYLHTNPKPFVVKNARLFECVLCKHIHYLKKDAEDWENAMHGSKRGRK